MAYLLLEQYGRLAQELAEDPGKSLAAEQVVEAGVVVGVVYTKLSGRQSRTHGSASFRS